MKIFVLFQKIPCGLYFITRPRRTLKRKQRVCEQATVVPKGDIKGWSKKAPVDSAVHTKGWIGNHVSVGIGHFRVPKTITSKPRHNFKDFKGKLDYRKLPIIKSPPQHLQDHLPVNKKKTSCFKLPPPPPLACIEINSPFYNVLKIKNRSNKNILICTTTQPVLKHFFQSGCKRNFRGERKLEDPGEDPLKKDGKQQETQFISNLLFLADILVYIP